MEGRVRESHGRNGKDGYEVNGLVLSRKGDHIQLQESKMGCSVDWERAYFTMNDVGLARVARIFSYLILPRCRDLAQPLRSPLYVSTMTTLYTEQTDWSTGPVH